MPAPMSRLAATAITRTARLTDFGVPLTREEIFAPVVCFCAIVALRVLLFAAALHPTTMHSPESAAQSLWYLDSQPGHLNEVALPISLKQRGQTLEAMVGISFQLSAPGGARSVAP
jgi:hypothetical protein